MEDILEKAREYRSFADLRREAHYGSSEWHRARGARYGVAATLVSAIVTSSIFAAFTKYAGLSGGELKIVITTGWGWALMVAVVLLLVLSPVLTGVTAYLNDPDQAQRHNVSSAKYLGTKQRLDLFILRYTKRDVSNRDQPLQELQKIRGRHRRRCQE